MCVLSSVNEVARYRTAAGGFFRTWAAASTETVEFLPVLLDVSPGLIRFNDQDDSIGQLSHQGCLSFTGKRRCAEEDVIEFLAQFSEARSTAFHVPVEISFRRA